jgi:uncharacterized protein YodC (DUF2158 family)
MTIMKSGDLVVLKSGGPTMTVDTVNTDIFDGHKVTGIFCLWFVGEKLERVRFDPESLEPARLQQAASFEEALSPAVTTADYKVVLDEMVTAMNLPAEDSGRISDKVPKQRKAKSAPKRNHKGERSSRRLGTSAPILDPSPLEL